MACQDRFPPFSFSVPPRPHLVAERCRFAQASPALLPIPDVSRIRQRSDTRGASLAFNQTYPAWFRGR